MIGDMIRSAIGRVQARQGNPPIRHQPATVQPAPRADLDRLAAAAERRRAGICAINQVEAQAIARGHLTRYGAEGGRMIQAALTEALARGYNVAPHDLRKEGGL
jgi:stage V sporulation protein SpoVS